MTEGMFNRTVSVNESDIAVTRIGKGSTVDGDLVFSGCLVVDGCVTGFVMSVPGTPGSLLRLSAGASVGGDIHVQSAVVLGSVGGAVHVVGHAELGVSARIMKNLRCESIEMQHGAFVGGAILVGAVSDE